MTASVETVYHVTSFNDGTDMLYAQLTLTNVGSYSITGPVLVGVKNLSTPLVGVENIDGVTPDLPVIRDPDGFFVELQQPDPLPASAATTQGDILGGSVQLSIEAEPRYVSVMGNAGIEYGLSVSRTWADLQAIWLPRLLQPR